MIATSCLAGLYSVRSRNAAVPAGVRCTFCGCQMPKALDRDVQFKRPADPMLVHRRASAAWRWGPPCGRCHGADAMHGPMLHACEAARMLRPPSRHLASARCLCSARGIASVHMQRRIVERAKRRLPSLIPAGRLRRLCRVERLPCLPPTTAACTAVAASTSAAAVVTAEPAVSNVD
eukprot:352199-Chlamydomonas_euryale.AAC.13